MSKPPLHFDRSFCIDEIQKLEEGVVSFHKLRIDKAEHKGKLYYAKYSDSNNEPTYTYYGAKISNNNSTYGGTLPLMNEFISSTILHSISHLRSERLFCAPAVLMHVENGADNFRLLSRMLPNFEPLQSSKISCDKSSAYLAGVITAMQEIDPNFSNYGTCRDESGKQLAAKIDSNSFYEKGARHKKHGGLYFNDLQRPGIREEGIVTDRDYGNYGALVAAAGVFDTMSPDKDSDRIRFVGEENNNRVVGRLRIKRGGEKNFKYFMLGVQDFIAMPDEFINFIYRKTLNDLRKKSVPLARQETENIGATCNRIIALKQTIAEYFSNELAHFHHLLKKEGKEYHSPWDNVMRSTKGEEKSTSSEGDISFDSDEEELLPTPPNSSPIKKKNAEAVISPPAALGHDNVH